MRQASMRPRRVRLGYGAADYQWYRECAASMRPRRVRLGYGLLARRCVVAALDASMRPRRVRLGDGFELDRVAGHFGASMRPRRVRLGYGPAPALEPLALPVHRFNEAQTLRPGRYPYLRGIVPPLPVRAESVSMLSYYLIVKERKKVASGAHAGEATVKLRNLPVVIR